MKSSHIEIGSISIDLPTFADDDKNDPGKCDHFSLRGFVSEVRKKDWKACWPFPVNESEEQPSFPPMDVPKFKRSSCQKCREKDAAEVTPGNDKTSVSCRNGCNAVVSSGIQQAPVPNGTPVTEEIDLNKPIDDPSCDTDCLTLINEIENNADVVNNEITDHDIGLENNPNHHLSSVPQPEVYPGVIIEENTNIIGDDVVVVVSNVEDTTEDGDVTDHTTGLLSPESVAVNHDVPMGDNIEKTDKNDFQNHTVEKLSGSIRKKPRKTRLLSELVNNIGEPKTDRATTKGSASHCGSNPSAAADTQLVFPDNVDVQGDTTLTNKGQGRKRKLLVDEESRPGNNEVQNQEGDIEKINTIGKKHKKLHHVDDNLISRPPQGQQRESEGAVDIANKETPSKSPPGFFPRASAEKRMDGFLSDLLRKKNDCNSKGKGKMLQAGKELDSLFSRKNDKLVEVSSAHTGVKNVSSMPQSTAVPSEKGTLNGELAEGSYLSSKCYSSEQIHNKQSIHQTEIQLPFSFGNTSRLLPIRKENEINFFREERIPSNHMSNAISTNGNGVQHEVMKGGGNNDKTAEVIVLDSPEIHRDTTTEEFEHGSLDDVTREVVEIMARNQYERSLPDVENMSGLLQKSTQRGTHQARYGENGMIRRGENMSLRKGNSITHFSPLEGNLFGAYNLHAIPYSCGLGVSKSKNKSSTGVNFSTIGARQHGPAQTSNFNRSIAQCGSSGTTLQAKGGSNLCKTMPQQDGVASLPWAPLNKKFGSIGFNYLPNKPFSQPSSSNMGLNSPWSNSPHMQNNKWDIDLNSPNCDIIDLEKLPRTNGSGDRGRTNAEYTFSGKNNWMEPHRNQREPLDSDSNEALQAMQTLSLMGAGRQSVSSSNVGFNAGMIHKPSYTGQSSSRLEKIAWKTHGSPRKRSSYDFSNSSSTDILSDRFREHQFIGTFSSVQHGEKFRNLPDLRDQNLTVCGKEEKRNSSNSMMQRSAIMQSERSNLETHTPQQHRSLGVSERLLNNPECSTMLNRNPAEFTLPDEESPYVIRGEDLKFEESIPEGSPALRARGRPKKNANPSKLCENH